MQLPFAMRDELVEDLDDYLEASPEAEAVSNYVIELLETYADDQGIDDFVSGLEEQGGVDGTLVSALEEEMTSNDEFEFTGEEIVSLLERMCDLEWDTEADGAGDDDDDDDDDDDF